MKIYGDKASGNCYKVQLICELLNVSYQWQAVDILQKDHQQPAFLALSPQGKIPLIMLDSGDLLCESNAIINFLASGSPLVPRDPLAYAKVQQWQFFEQYSHEPYIAVARFINKYLGLPADRLEEYQAKQAGGHRALAVMQQQLANTPYLTGDTLTTADISLYAYTHVAHEGGFSLDAYPDIVRWCQAIADTPGYISLDS